MERKPVSKKMRFDVFKRDKFTCQYCGRRAPDVVLHCDHITPVASGGKTTILNLVTSCFDCNSGKGKREISDNSAVAIQMNQLELIQERRNQLQLIKKWLEESGNIQDEYVDTIDAHVRKEFGCGLNEHGRKHMSSHIRKFGLMEVVECIGIASEQYEDVEEALGKLSGILNNRKMEREIPGYGKLSWAYGTLKKRFGSVDNRKFWMRVNEARDAGVDPEWILRLSQTCKYDNVFYSELNDEALRVQEEGE